MKLKPNILSCTHLLHTVLEFGVCAFIELLSSGRKKCIGWLAGWLSNKQNAENCLASKLDNWAHCTVYTHVCTPHTYSLSHSLGTLHIVFTVGSNVNTFFEICLRAKCLPICFMRVMGLWAMHFCAVLSFQWQWMTNQRKNARYLHFWLDIPFVLF